MCSSGVLLLVRILTVTAAIAVVGVGCRFSGSATSPEALWDMLSKGTTGWTKTASHRFNLNAFWHPNGDNKGTVHPSQQEDIHGLRYLT